jgi:hypothetical protein
MYHVYGICTPSGIEVLVHLVCTQYLGLAWYGVYYILVCIFERILQ